MRLVAALLALAGCGDNLPVFAEPRTIELTFPSAPNRKLDLLFMRDDSPGGPEIQIPLAQSRQEVRVSRTRGFDVRRGNRADRRRAAHGQADRS